MIRSSEPLWDLEELCAQVALALATDYPGQASGRVRDVPDGRTIRYYTTLGLVDRPVTTRGRTALYGRRHLLQLVAIKRLQATGLSLAEVQQRLVGLTGAALARVARLPLGTEDRGPKVEDRGSTSDRRDAHFWTAEPAQVETTRSSTLDPRS